MPDRPTDSADPPAFADAPARSLSEILTELAQLSHTQQGDASEMRSAVSELSRSLARLFEMIRTDRHDQRAKIAQLERELTAVRLQLAELGIEPAPAPAPNDFDQLRAAAERLRLRTQQLVHESAEEPASGELGAGPDDLIEPTSDEVEPTPDDPAEPASGEPEAGDDGLIGAGLAPVLRVIDGDASGAPTAPEPLEAAPRADAPDDDLEVESDLPLARAAEAPLPAKAAAPPQPVRPVARPEPLAVAPRGAAKRSLGLRRRRVDARKLAGVEPTAALGSMVGSVDQLWTAGCPVDLVVAFTDGGAVRVTGGDREPLRLEEVEPGTPARCTITATRRQLIPLFGRLALTDDESAPLIHGSRRDADLLVGWFDRAQRLPVSPL